MYFQRLILDVGIIWTQDRTKVTETMCNSVSKSLDVMC